MPARSGRASRILSVSLVVVAVIWAIARVAPGTIPEIAGAATRSAKWPIQHLPDYAAFVNASPVGQLAYRLAGALGTWEYVLIHVLAAAAAVALLAWWLARQAIDGHRGVAVRLVILSPIVALLVGFIGSYDPFTVLGMAGLLFAWVSGRRWALIAAGAYLGFQHFEQGAVAVTAATIAALALSDRRATPRPSPAWAFAGLIAGKLVLSFILNVTIGEGILGRNAFMTWEWIRPALTSSVNYGPVLLLSLFAGLWGVVVLGIVRLPNRGRVLMVVAFALCLVPMAIALDHTRVYVLCSLVPLLMLAEDLLQGSEVSRRELVLVEAMAWIVVPLFVWTSGERAGYLQHTGIYDLWVMFGDQLRAWW